ncbi:dihydropteroate synthase [Aciduliprofundum sp. MAR08-339]|uniref:dihydropteroate synthase n=1 Tax=Aciduliprofundum sp. (strain MAR08-339) TaxID=673860 RepID=UPI0002A49DF7|nr:dihydropteroate synthase [Aciduliprofundum sp. MAR08-339]
MFNPLVFHGNQGAKDMMCKIGVSKEGTEIMDKKSRFFILKLENLPLKGALLLKQEALAAGMECALPWCTAALNCEETDAVLFGTERQFEILMEKMKLQPFKGKTIAEEMHSAIENFQREKYTIRAREYRVSIPPTKIMGILNVTPNSFSDGGKYLDVNSAVSRAREMVREGVDIIDVGGESSRPFSEPVSEEEELRRIIPVIEELEDIKVPVSVDTYKPKVAEEALKRGASMVNDIYGLRKEGMAKVVADYDAAVVIMHMKGEPKNMQRNPYYEDTIGEIAKFLRDRVEFALRYGIEEDRIIIDPGIGFGKRVEDNLRILKYISAFKSLGFPILLGASRKSYMGKLFNLDVQDRLETTLASDVMAVMGGASIIRIHDVKENVRAIRMVEKIMEVGI